jgi:toxin ParE1/3/4
VVEIRLTELALQDLLAIEEFSFATFGREQTSKYLAGLREAFVRLGEHPGIGVVRDDLRAGSRSYRYGSHRIYYRASEDEVLIQRILHYARQVRRSMVHGD